MTPVFRLARPSGMCLAGILVLFGGDWAARAHRTGPRSARLTRIDVDHYAEFAIETAPRVPAAGSLRAARNSTGTGEVSIAPLPPAVDKPHGQERVAVPVSSPVIDALPLPFGARAPPPLRCSHNLPRSTKAGAQLETR